MNYNPMKALILSVFASLFAFQLHAQNTYTEKLRQNEAGKGSVIINHSPEIDNVVNHGNKKKSTTTTPVVHNTTKTQADKHTESVPHTAANTNKNEHKKEGKTEATHANTSKPHTGSTRPNVNGQKHYTSRARHKARGYRICIFTGGNTRADKMKAIEMGNKCRRLFKELAVYPSFEAPRWVTHVGDFKTHQEAQKYVARIRHAHFTYETRIVASEVNVPY